MSSIWSRLKSANHSGFQHAPSDNTKKPFSALGEIIITRGKKLLLTPCFHYANDIKIGCADRLWLCYNLHAVIIMCQTYSFWLWHVNYMPSSCRHEYYSQSNKTTNWGHRLFCFVWTFCCSCWLNGSKDKELRNIGKVIKANQSLAVLVVNGLLFCWYIPPHQFCKRYKEHKNCLTRE